MGCCCPAAGKDKDKRNAKSPRNLRTSPPRSRASIRFKCCQTSATGPGREGPAGAFSARVRARSTQRNCSKGRIRASERLRILTVRRNALFRALDLLPGQSGFPYPGPYWLDALEGAAARALASAFTLLAWIRSSAWFQKAEPPLAISPITTVLIQPSFPVESEGKRPVMVG